MPLRPGDTLVLTLSPSVQVMPFTMVKPSVSLERVIGDDPEADYQDALATVRACLVRSAKVEVEIIAAANVALGGVNDLPELLNTLEKEISCANPQTKTVQSKVPAQGSSNRPRPKA